MKGIQVHFHHYIYSYILTRSLIHLKRLIKSYSSTILKKKLFNFATGFCKVQSISLLRASKRERNQNTSFFWKIYWKIEVRINDIFYSSRQKRMKCSFENERKNLSKEHYHDKCAYFMFKMIHTAITGNPYRRIRTNLRFIYIPIVTLNRTRHLIGR